MNMNMVCSQMYYCWNRHNKQKEMTSMHRDLSLMNVSQINKDLAGDEQSWGVLSFSKS